MQDVYYRIYMIHNTEYKMFITEYRILDVYYRI